MKIGLGLYRHMLSREYYDLARQTGCTQVVIHLVDYFHQGPTNPRNNQPTGGHFSIRQIALYLLRSKNRNVSLYPWNHIRLECLL